MFVVIVLAGAVACSSCSGRSQGKGKAGTPGTGIGVAPKISPEPMSEKSLLAFALEAAEAGLVPTVGQEPNLTFKSTLLADIAAAYAQAGKFDKALSLVEKATEKDNPGLQAEALGRIAIAYLEAGMPDEMGALVDRIEQIKDWQSSPALAEVSMACAEAGKIDLAAQVAGKIASGADRAAAFIAAAEKCLEAGSGCDGAKVADLLGRATKAANDAEASTYDIQEPGSSDMRIWIYDRAPTFSLLLDAAKVYVQAGRMDEAKNVAGLVETYKGDHYYQGNLAGWRARILLEAAQGYMEAQKKDKALETLTQALTDIEAMIPEKVGDIEDRTALFVRGAGLLDELGEKDKALKLLESALDEARKLEKVDVADIRVGNGCAALALVAGKHADLGAKDKAVAILGEALKIIESEKKVSKDGGDKDRAVAMAELASVYAKAGESAKADELFSRASDACAKIEDFCWKAQARADMVDIFLRDGKHDKAKTEAASLQETLRGKLESCWVGGGEGYKKIIEAMNKEGRQDEIMAVADMMDASWYRVEVLAALAKHYEKTGKKDKADLAVLKALETVEAESEADSTLRARELLLLADTCVSSKKEAAPAALAILEKLLKKK